MAGAFRSQYFWYSIYLYAGKGSIVVRVEIITIMYTVYRSNFHRVHLFNVLYRTLLFLPYPISYQIRQIAQIAPHQSIFPQFTVYPNQNPNLNPNPNPHFRTTNHIPEKHVFLNPFITLEATLLPPFGFFI